MAQTYAWDDLMWTEMADLGKLLQELTDDEFDRDSLCDGWQVRDVVGHMLLGHTTPMLKMIGLIARYRFNVTRASLEQSRDYARSLTPDEIRTQWDGVVANRTERGIAKLISAKEGYVDHTVHHQDIRRALDRPRTIPSDRLVAALDGTVSVSTPMFSPKKNVAGVHLEAPDIGWSHGSGPDVRGAGEAILMVAAGRRAALSDLEGDGVDVLRARLGA
jgi:uncharacterized protein (TIGR03083 family)